MSVVTVIVPEVPAEVESGNVEGATAASEIAKFGVELVWPVTLLVSEAEPRWIESPA